MFISMKHVCATLTVVSLAIMLSGCGDSENEGTSAPVVKLTASTVTSSTDSAHAHSVVIPFVDVSASPADTGYQYRSDTVSSHSHVIALSKQQMIDLNNGMQLSLISSAPSSGTSHTHTWTLQGGGVLYEKNCYNCHSNTKRGQNPMNVVFNASQILAVKSQFTAPLSTATPAIPDPAYIPGSAPLDGASLYAGACAGCHGPLATTTKPNRTAVQIRAAINNDPVTGMGGLSTLTDAQLQAIAAALVK
jgi:mono/diheme cytochrome c family protein